MSNLLVAGEDDHHLLGRLDEIHRLKAVEVRRALLSENDVTSEPPRDGQASILSSQHLLVMVEGRLVSALNGYGRHEADWSGRSRKLCLRHRRCAADG